MFEVERGDPSQLSRKPTAVWVGACRGAERLGASVIRCEGDYRSTAAAAHVFGERLLAAGRPGCFNPEDLFVLADLRDALQDVGMRVGDASPKRCVEKRAVHVPVHIS